MNLHGMAPLPIDIFYRILSFLDGNSKYQASLVSRLWNVSLKNSLITEYTIALLQLEASKERNDIICKINVLKDTDFKPSEIEEKLKKILFNITLDHLKQIKTGGELIELTILYRQDPTTIMQDPDKVKKLAAKITKKYGLKQALHFAKFYKNKEFRNLVLTVSVKVAMENIEDWSKVFELIQNQRMFKNKTKFKSHILSSITNKILLKEINKVVDIIKSISNQEVKTNVIEEYTVILQSLNSSDEASKLRLLI